MFLKGAEERWPLSTSCFEVKERVMYKEIDRNPFKTRDIGCQQNLGQGWKDGVLEEGGFSAKPGQDLCVSRNYKGSGSFTGAWKTKTQTGRDSVTYVSHCLVPRLQVFMTESSLGS